MADPLVCEACLNRDPRNASLLSFKCLKPADHRYSRRVPVRYSRTEHQLVEVDQIRPLPHLRLPPNKRFILCKNAGGSCSRGDNCTFAHSKEEQEEWNAQLLEQDSASKIGGFIKFPHQSQFTLQESQFPELSPASPSLPHNAPLSPPSGGFSFAQATRNKQSRSHSTNLRQPHHFPSLQSCFPPASNMTRPSSGHIPYQRSTSASQFRPTPQSSQVKGHQGTKSQGRSLSESSADQRNVGHHGVSDPQYSTHPQRQGLTQKANMAAQSQASAQTSFPGFPNRPQAQEHERQQQADRLYGRSNSEHAQYYREPGHTYPGVATPTHVTYPGQPTPPYHSTGPPVRQLPIHYPNPPAAAQFPFSPPSHVPPAPHINPSPYHVPPSTMNTPQQVDDWPMMGSVAPPQPHPLHPAPRPNPAPPTRAPVPSQPTHTGGVAKGGMTPSHDPVYAPLSRENYKTKFTSLLNLEEKEHKRVLEEKCNGQYLLVLYQYGAKPPNIRRAPDGARYRRYGFLNGITGDQVAYATQASQGMINILSLGNVNICKADILRDNYNHIDEKLYIAFEVQEDQRLQGGFNEARLRGKVQFPVNVRFVLKHTYFRNLKYCVGHISSEVIEKIVPLPSTFRVPPNTNLPDLTPSANLCSPDQLEALQAILTCPSEGPPNVIVGPFGTGKTRILAIAAKCFFDQARSCMQPARILVCTQQRESVDNFYDHFHGLFGREEVGLEMIILRDYGYRHVATEEKNIYKTIQSFLHYRRFLNVQQNHLIMSTCLMVRELVRDLGTDFFTHILIDEGAQMREPEAIAPLSLANPNKTKIVIAGDQHQVGPAMLVFGEVPLNQGLGTSLLERLYSTYKRLRQESYISTLVTNYRSHPDIVELPSALFYETPLISPGDREPPSPYPKYNHPLVFLCSSVDQAVCQVDDNINEEEASILLDEASKLAKNWPIAQWGPPDLSQACIMSPSRPQLTVANQLIYEKKLSSRLKPMRRLPTYDMQGREFRALFLSTSEPTNADASTKNPTKSLCDRHIFNTAITRAQSLVVAVGNPYLLLKTEETMIKRYGKKGKVWSNYLKRCLENNSFIIPDMLKLKPAKKAAMISKLKKLVVERVADPDSVGAPQVEVATGYDDEEFPPLAPPSRSPLQAVVEVPTAPPPITTVTQVANQSVAHPQQQLPQHNGRHSYLPQQSPAAQPQVVTPPPPPITMVPQVSQSVTNPQHDNRHGYLPQQLPAAQPPAVTNNSASFPSIPEGSQGAWSLSNVESLLSFPPPSSEESHDLFQRFPALFASQTTGTTANQSSTSSMQPPASYTQQPMGVTYGGHMQPQPSPVMNSAHAHIQPQVPQPVNTIPDPVQQHHMTTSYGHMQQQPPQATSSGYPHIQKLPQAMSTASQQYMQPQIPQGVSTGPDHIQPQISQAVTGYHQLQPSQVTSPGYDPMQPQFSQPISTVHAQIQPSAATIPSGIIQNHHGDPSEVTSPLVDNVFSPIEQHPLPNSGQLSHGATHPGKQVPYSDPDTEVEEVLSKSKPLETTFSSVWTGGEMRVSPEPKSSRQENLPDGPSKVVAGYVYSDDTFRKTPSPVTPVNKRGGASVIGATPTTTTTTTRLEKDYEVREQIGKGGFGVVFHVRNKLDEHEYALKLIRLSNVSKEQDKVMREVRALAQLEHPHIVRYHTSWKERAPDRWTEKRFWSILKSSETLPSAVVPVVAGVDSTHTTPRATAPNSTHTSVSTDDFSLGGNEEITEDSVVTFRDSKPANSSPPPPPRDYPSHVDLGRRPPLPDHTSPPTCLFIQTELCLRDTLRVWLLKNCEEKKRTKRLVLEYFQQILEALVYIHREKFVHRDLKPSNIFFSRREQRLKIGDFGLVTTGVVLPHGGGDAARVGSVDSHSVQAGTFLYMSPEQIRGQKCDEKSDMFALGLIFFELHYCMKTDAQKYRVLDNLRRLEFPSQFIERLPNEVSSIIKSLLAPDPDKRPRAAELKDQKSLKNLDKKVRKSKREYIPVF